MAATRSQMRKRGGKGKGKSAKDEPTGAGKTAADAKKNDDGTTKKEGKEGEQEYEIVYKNGKAYRKLKDLPDVGYLITYGLPGQEGKSSRDPTKPW